MNAVNVRRIIFRSNHGDILRAYSMSSCLRCSGEFARLSAFLDLPQAREA